MKIITNSLLWITGLAILALPMPHLAAQSYSGLEFLIRDVAAMKSSLGMGEAGSERLKSLDSRIGELEDKKQFGGVIAGLDKGVTDERIGTLEERASDLEIQVDELMAANDKLKERIEALEAGK